MNEPQRQALHAEIRFEGSSGCASWKGYGVPDAVAFARYLRERVMPRATDTAAGAAFDVELRALAGTGMASGFVERLLRAVSPPQGWEIGEALAECVLQDHNHGDVCWPWNTARDRRTPRASLPGADLVGFLRRDGIVLLLIGEVKTSSDLDSPPNVMHGGGSLTWQLQENATRLDIQHSLLKWLRHRCTSEDHVALYRSAVGRYLQSGGTAILLAGVLVRDTSPRESDIVGRAKALGGKLAPPACVEIAAWYVPVPIKDWTGLLRKDDD